MTSTDGRAAPVLPAVAASAVVAEASVIDEADPARSSASEVVRSEVTVGVIGRAHGVRGEVSVQPRTDEPERRFAVGQRVRSAADDREFEVVGHRLHQGRLLVRFDQLADRTAAEAARGTVLVAEVDLTERPTEDEEFYDRQLVGLAVRTTDGVQIGTVISVLHLPAQDVLEIETAKDRRLVPFVADLVPRVDLDQGLLEIADRPGLLDDIDEAEPSR